MSEDASVAFLTVGLQLLPILWVVLLVETASLRRAFQSPTTRENRADRTFLRFGLIWLGIGAEAFGLLSVYLDNQTMRGIASFLLLMALMISLGVAAFSLSRQLEPKG